jgi:hypothetical protein
MSELHVNQIKGFLTRELGAKIDMSDYDGKPHVDVENAFLTRGLAGYSLVNALRALLKAEHERGPDFLRLTNALSALYPMGSEEKRLFDAMLLAVPR